METSTVVFLVFFVGIPLSAAIGFLIGQSRGRAVDGALLSLLLGPLGWLLVLAGPDARRRCAECRGPVPQEATRCMHCGAQLPAEAAKPDAGDDSPPPGSLGAVGLAYTFNCPACGSMNSVPFHLLNCGTICEQCGRGFVPIPSAGRHRHHLHRP